MSGQTQAVQVKVTLPNELYFYLKSRADKFGLTLSSYLKNLALNDVKDLNMPVFKMSAGNEDIAVKALEDFKKGKTRNISDIDEYLDQL